MTQGYSVVWKTTDKLYQNVAAINIKRMVTK